MKKTILLAILFVLVPIQVACEIIAETCEDTIKGLDL